MAQLTVPRSRRLVLAMKLETTYGSDVFAGSYALGDVIPAFDIQPDGDIAEIINLAQGGQLGRLPSVQGRRKGTVRFSVWVRGRNTAYANGTRPEIDLPLRGCGLSSVVDTTGGAEKVTYVGTDTHESMTLYISQENGTTLQLTGGHGTGEITADAGGVGVATFAYEARLDDEALVTFVSGTPSPTPPYPTLRSALFQISTENYAARLQRAAFALGNQIQEIQDQNDAAAIAGVIIADRDPRLTLDPEAAPLATMPWFTKLTAGTLMDCTYQIGTAQYNRLKFSFDRLQLVRLGWWNRNGVTTRPMTLLASINAGNDDFSLVFD